MHYQRSFRGLKQGFLTLARLIMFWLDHPLWGRGDQPVHCGVFSVTPHLCPLNASSTDPTPKFWYQKKMSSDAVKCPLEDELCPAAES